MLRLTKSSVTGLVHRSERNGLVRREADQLDVVRTNMVCSTNSTFAIYDPRKIRTIFNFPGRITDRPLAGLGRCRAAAAPTRVAGQPRLGSTFCSEPRMSRKSPDVDDSSS